MHPKIEELQVSLKALREALDKAIPNDEPFTSQGGWNAPSISWSDLDEAIRDLEELIELHGQDAQVGNVEAYDALIARVKFLQDSTIPNIWGNPVSGLPAFYISISSWHRDIQRLLKSDPRHEVTEELKSLRRRLRAAEATLGALEPSIERVVSMVADIRP